MTRVRGGGSFTYDPFSVSEGETGGRAGASVNPPITFKVRNTIESDRKCAKVHLRKSSVTLDKQEAPKRPNLAGEINRKSLAPKSDQAFS